MKKAMQLIILASVIMAWGCSEIGYKKTKNGLQYKIISGGKDQKLKVGDIIKFNMMASYNDSTIYSTYTFVPTYAKVEATSANYDFRDFLQEMNVGDSAVMLQAIDTMLKTNPGLPKTFKPGTSVKVGIKVLSILPGGEKELSADYSKEMEHFKNGEMAQIERYLTDNKIKAEKLSDLVYVEIQQQGSGPKADSGKYVGIKYTGSFLGSGKAFDSNMDSTKQTQKHDLSPYYFVSKQQGAIAGMLIGITAFNQGGKGRMFIPSVMAYGNQGMPPAIGPNEKLIFDIELVDVKDSTPRMPGMAAQMPSREEIEKAAKEKGNGDVRSQKLPKNQ
jgi:FKBP-type peptidyl-prolyl cis-trans isomerase FkpA